jgi:hypothetical protein
MECVRDPDHFPARAASAFFRETSNPVPKETTMTRKAKPTGNDAEAVDSNRIKDPEEWTTGEEPMTGAQESYLKTLAAEAGETVDPDLTKAEASRRIDELQSRTGRGQR